MAVFALWLMIGFGQCEAREDTGDLEDNTVGEVIAHLLPGFRGNEPARGLVSRVHRRHAWTRHTKARSIFASFPLAHFCLKAYNCTACLIYICP